MKQVTYAAVYERLFRVGGSTGSVGVNKWSCRRMSTKTPVRTRLWVARHLIRIHKTQHVGVLLRDETMRRVFECYRLASLDARLLLRRLQHRILMYLYRPGGTLAQREAQKLSELLLWGGL